MVKVIYYITPSGKNVVREFIFSLQKQQQVKVRRTLQLIKRIWSYICHSSYQKTIRHSHLGNPYFRQR